MRLLTELGRALAEAGSMTWQITWSLILGFTLSAVIQAVVRREAIARHLGNNNTRMLALATGLGAASSSCSYAAVALARLGPGQRVVDGGGGERQRAARVHVAANLAAAMPDLPWVAAGLLTAGRSSGLVGRS